jgi:competence ComEA-like helix-hairpin-helix protein
MSENEELEAFVVDLNTGSEEELSRLPGIGPVLATRIVDYREEVGLYPEPADVVAVPGITASLYDRLAGQLTAGQLGDLPIDLNSANEEDLSRLPGIGAVLATRIVHYREEVGPFQEPADVVAVPGVTASLYDRFAGEVMAGQVESVPAMGPEEPAVEVEAEAEAEGGERDDLEMSEPEPLGVPEEEPVAAPDQEEPDMDIDLEADLEAASIEWDEPEPAEPEPPVPLEEDEPAEIPEPPEPFDEQAEEVMPESALAFGDLDEDLSTEELVEETAEADEPPAPVSEPPPFVVVPREDRGGCWRLLAVGLMSALAGAALSLVILVMINGTLNYQIATRQVLKAEVARLDGEIGTLNKSLAGLQSSLESMEDLAAELDGAQADIRRLADDLTILHGSLERLAGDLDDTQAALGGLAGDVEELEENVVALQTQFSTVEDQLNTLSGELDSVREATDRFEGFLDGLRSLLGQTAKPTPEDSPFSLESPSPTSVPPTRQPVFTVIPLATPTPIP